MEKKENNRIAGAVRREKAQYTVLDCVEIVKKQKPPAYVAEDFCKKSPPA